MEKKPLFDVFMQLMNQHDITIGFEESDLDKDHNDYHFETNVAYEEKPETGSPSGRPPVIRSGGHPLIDNHLISVDFICGDLAKIMDSVTAQLKNYRWEIIDNVINIIPVEGRDTRFEELLNLRISQFAISKGAKVGLIQPLIVLQLPELKSFLAEHRLAIESSRAAPWFTERPLPAAINVSDVTFKGLLNSITRTKRGGWILRHSKPLIVGGKVSMEILI